MNGCASLFAHSFEALGAAIVSVVIVSALLGFVFAYAFCRIVSRLAAQRTDGSRGLLLSLCVAVAIGVAVAAFYSMLRPAYELWDRLL